jgi:DedD protein
MALFKFRKGDDDRVATATQPESIDVMRKRARHRLIGAAVLVLAAVIGFPMIFDTQPRPIAVDIPIEIPDRGKTKPLVIPAPATPAAALAPSKPAAPMAAGPVTAPALPPVEAKVATSASLDAKEQLMYSKPAPKAEIKAEPKLVEKPMAKVEPKPEPKPSVVAAPKADDGAKAKALLEGKSVESTAAPAVVEGRFVVQIGAFAESARAQEARLKVERAGLKTYTQVAETKDGKRIRVRVGPYGTRADAEKAASKIKGLDLPAAILTL